MHFTLLHIIFNILPLFILKFIVLSQPMILNKNMFQNQRSYKCYQRAYFHIVNTVSTEAMYYLISCFPNQRSYTHTYEKLVIRNHSQHYYLQRNFRPVNEIGGTILLNDVEGNVPEDFPTGAYIRNGEFLSVLTSYVQSSIDYYLYHIVHKLNHGRGLEKFGNKAQKEIMHVR